MGITGGIASGKSAVAAILRELGFHVIDADELGHTLIEPGQPAYGEILREFGASVLGEDGRIDRAKLGAMVFADAEKLARLNAMVHPRVETEIHRQFADWEKDGVRDAAFVEAALLVEAGYQKRFGWIGGGVVSSRAAGRAIAGAGFERGRGAAEDCGANACGGKIKIRDGED